MGKSLYSLTEEAVAVEDSLEGLFESCADNGREPTLEEIQEFFKYTESLGILLAEKIDAYVFLIRKTEGDLSIAQTELDDWRRKEKARKNKLEVLKAALRWHMDATKQSRIETGKFKLTIVNNGGVVPVEVFNEGELPPEMLYYPPPVPDKEAIREALELGKEVAGAKLGERGKHLRIK